MAALQSMSQKFELSLIAMKESHEAAFTSFREKVQESLEVQLNLIRSTVLNGAIKSDVSEANIILLENHTDIPELKHPSKGYPLLIKEAPNEKGIPQYSLPPLNAMLTVANVYNEYKYGYPPYQIPSTSQLESKHKAKWRPQEGVKWGRRKYIWERVESLMKTGLDEAHAVSKVRIKLTVG